MKKRKYKSGQLIESFNQLAKILRDRDPVCLHGVAKSPSFIEQMSFKTLKKLISRKRLTIAELEKEN